MESDNDDDRINTIEYTTKMRGRYDRILGEMQLYAEGTYNLYSVTAVRGPDMRLTCYNIFIYSNLVRETLVGNVMVPILRAVPVDKEMDGKYVGLSFDRLHYRPIAGNFFEYIDIKLTNDMGENLKFTWGKVVVTISLRKRKS